MAYILLAFFIALVTAGDGTARADTEQAPDRLRGFLDDYRQAFVEGNPLLLHKYDPSGRVFGPLVGSAWFDHVRRTKVELTDMQITEGEDGVQTISFLKVQEDIQRDGLFTRGVARISLKVRTPTSGVRVLSHRAVVPEGSSPDYRSADPRTWGEEHSLVEKKLYLGLEYLREGDISSAEEYISLAAEMVEHGNLPRLLMGPAYFEATCYYFLAMLRVKRGDFSAAVDDLERALSLHPEFPAALNLKAEIHLGEAEYEPAVELWSASLDLYSDQPAIAAVVSVLKLALEAKKKRRGLLLSLINLPPSQAVQVLAPAVKRSPRDKQLVPLLAKAYLASNDPELAQQVLKSSRQSGKNLEITYLAARTELKLQHQDEALELFEKVWTLQPNYQDTLVFLVCLYSSTDQYQEAVALLKLAGESFGDLGLLNALLGKYNLMAGRFLDGVSYFERATAARLPSRLRSEVASMLLRISRQGR